MGKCVCVTMEEVRKCQAKCGPEPRKKSKEPKSELKSLKKKKK